jgi:Protein of unknown function (DUF4019)
MIESPLAAERSVRRAERKAVSDNRAIKEDNMKNRNWLFMVPIAACLALSAWGANTPEDAAQAAADSWLKLVDTGNYEASWEQAAKVFKSAVTKDQWTQTAGAVRTPLGKLISRKLKSREYTEQLPGAPDGKYVVIQFDAVFENKAAAVETVTPMLDPHGVWRVSGYFIR